MAWICCCNPFNDAAVKKHLEDNPDTKQTVSSTYKACSGGNLPNCGQCVSAVKEIVQAHYAEQENEGAQPEPAADNPSPKSKPAPKLQPQL
jgi:bacterioferritin-associated ferredoxin